MGEGASRADSRILLRFLGRGRVTAVSDRERVAASEIAGKLQVVLRNMANQPTADKANRIHVDPQGAAGQVFGESVDRQVKLLVQFAVRGVDRIAFRLHDRLFVAKVRFGILHQTIEDALQSVSLRAAEMAVMKFVDQGKQIPVFLIDLVDADPVLHSPA